MKKMDFIFFDAGGGHRSAANAVRQVIEEQHRPWEIRLVNLQEVLDPLDMFRKFTGIRLQDLYNLMLKHGWTLGSEQLVRFMHVLIRAYHRQQVRLLETHWRQSRPDLVVSFVPNFNRALGDSLRRSLPKVPLVTVLTDLADYPPHFWIEKDSQFVICGSDRAMEQARQLGHNDPHVFQTSGMILSPRFYEPIVSDRASERSRLGLDPKLATGLVLFGGQGSRIMLDIARTLDRSSLPVQLILICGHNLGLANAMRKLRWRIPMFVEEFTKQIPYYMHLADFFIGKPGPGSISEALAMELPVIVERNAWTLPQERYNAEWIVEKQVGLALRSFRHVDKAVKELLRSDVYTRFRANAAALNNQAVFEIPGILQRVLERCENSV